MSSPPWEADRLLTPEGARMAIGASFPNVDSRTLERLGSGFEFDVFLTADGWVFRFPRRAWYGSRLESERRVHELVSRVLPRHVALPTVELLSEPIEGFPYRFAGHRFISGVPSDSVSLNFEAILAADLAASLQAIHSVPEEEARAAGLSELEMEEEARWKWLEEGLRYASGLSEIHPSIAAALRWAGEVSVPPPPYQGPPRLIHHDLSPEHLIADARTGRLMGILDWTDAILGDPARDFVGLVTARGWSFAELVLESYHMPVDEGFRDRLDLLARLLSVVWLAAAQVRGADTERAVRGVRNAFRGRHGSWMG